MAKSWMTMSTVVFYIIIIINIVISPFTINGNEMPRRRHHRGIRIKKNLNDSAFDLVPTSISPGNKTIYNQNEAGNATTIFNPATRNDSDILFGGKILTKSPNNTIQPSGKPSNSGGGFVRWTVIIILMLIPIILMVLILLLTSGRKRNAESQRKMVTSLEHPVKLIPTIITEHWFPLSNSNVVRLDPKTLRQYYHLDGDTTVKFVRTTQLYHPLSGLLFQLVPNALYDPMKKVILISHDEQLRPNKIMAQGGQFEQKPSSIHQVYSSYTNEVFDRYLFMAYDPIREQFYLPDDSSQGNSNRIPRLPLKYSPNEYYPIYQHLLENSLSQKRNTVKFPIAQQPRPQQGPLLMDKKDFSKPQTIDFQETPRSTMVPQVKSPKQIPKDLEEKSQYSDVMSAMVKA